MLSWLKEKLLVRKEALDESDCSDGDEVSKPPEQHEVEAACEASEVELEGEVKSLSEISTSFFIQESKRGKEHHQRYEAKVEDDDSSTINISGYSLEECIEFDEKNKLVTRKSPLNESDSSDGGDVLSPPVREEVEASHEVCEVEVTYPSQINTTFQGQVCSIISSIEKKCHEKNGGYVDGDNNSSEIKVSGNHKEACITSDNVKTSCDDQKDPKNKTSSSFDKDRGMPTVNKDGCKAVEGSSNNNIQGRLKISQVDQRAEMTNHDGCSNSATLSLSSGYQTYFSNPKLKQVEERLEVKNYIQMSCLNPKLKQVEEKSEVKNDCNKFPSSSSVDDISEAKQTYISTCSPTYPETKPSLPKSHDLKKPAQFGSVSSKLTNPSRPSKADYANSALSVLGNSALESQGVTRDDTHDGTEEALNTEREEVYAKRNVRQNHKCTEETMDTENNMMYAGETSVNKQDKDPHQLTISRGNVCISERADKSFRSIPALDTDKPYYHGGRNDCHTNLNLTYADECIGINNGICESPPSSTQDKTDGSSVNNENSNINQVTVSLQEVKLTSINDLKVDKDANQAEKKRDVGLLVQQNQESVAISEKQLKREESVKEAQEEVRKYDKQEESSKGRRQIYAKMDRRGEGEEIQHNRGEKLREENENEEHKESNGEATLKQEKGGDGTRRRENILHTNENECEDIGSMEETKPSAEEDLTVKHHQITLSQSKESLADQTNKAEVKEDEELKEDEKQSKAEEIMQDLLNKQRGMIQELIDTDEGRIQDLLNREEQMIHQLVNTEEGRIQRIQEMMNTDEGIMQELVSLEERSLQVQEQFTREERKMQEGRSLQKLLNIQEGRRQEKEKETNKAEEKMYETVNKEEQMLEQLDNAERSRQEQIKNNDHMVQQLDDVKGQMQEQLSEEEQRVQQLDNVEGRRQEQINMDEQLTQKQVQNEEILADELSKNDNITEDLIIFEESKAQEHRNNSNVTTQLKSEARNEQKQHNGEALVEQENGPKLNEEKAHMGGVENTAQDQVQMPAGVSVPCCFPPAYLPPTCLYNQPGKLCTLLGDRYIITRVNSAPVLVSTSITSNELGVFGLVLLWHNGFPVVLNEVPDETDVIFDAVIPPRKTELVALIIWQKAKPCFSIEPYFDCYIILNELHSLKVKLVSFAKQTGVISAVIQGREQLIKFSKSVVYINGQKVDKTMDITKFKNCEYGQLFADVCVLVTAGVDNQVNYSFTCNCLWVGVEPLQHSLPQKFDYLTLYGKRSTNPDSFHVNKRQFYMHCDAQVELLCSENEWNLEYVKNGVPIKIPCSDESFYCGNQRVMPTSGEKVMAHVRRYVNKKGIEYFRVGMVQIPESLVARPEAAQTSQCCLKKIASSQIKMSSSQTLTVSPSPSHQSVATTSPSSQSLSLSVTTSTRNSLVTNTVSLSHPQTTASIDQHISATAALDHTDTQYSTSSQPQHTCTHSPNTPSLIIQPTTETTTTKTAPVKELKADHSSTGPNTVPHNVKDSGRASSQSCQTTTNNVIKNPHLCTSISESKCFAKADDLLPEINNCKVESKRGESISNETEKYTEIKSKEKSVQHPVANKGKSDCKKTPFTESHSLPNDESITEKDRKNMNTNTEQSLDVPIYLFLEGELNIFDNKFTYTYKGLKRCITVTPDKQLDQPVSPVQSVHNFHLILHTDSGHPVCGWFEKKNRKVYAEHSLTLYDHDYEEERLSLLCNSGELVHFQYAGFYVVMGKTMQPIQESIRQRLKVHVIVEEVKSQIIMDHEVSKKVIFLTSNNVLCQQSLKFLALGHVDSDDVELNSDFNLTKNQIQCQVSENIHKTSLVSLSVQDNIKGVTSPETATKIVLYICMYILRTHPEVIDGDNVETENGSLSDDPSNTENNTGNTIMKPENSENGSLSDDPSNTENNTGNTIMKPEKLSHLVTTTSEFAIKLPVFEEPSSLFSSTSTFKSFEEMKESGCSVSEHADQRQLQLAHSSFVLGSSDHDVPCVISANATNPLDLTKIPQHRHDGKVDKPHETRLCSYLKLNQLVLVAEDYALLRDTDKIVLARRLVIYSGKAKVTGPLTDLVKVKSGEVEVDAVVVPLPSPITVTGYTVTHEALVGWFGGVPSRGTMMNDSSIDDCCYKRGFGWEEGNEKVGTSRSKCAEGREVSEDEFRKINNDNQSDLQQEEEEKDTESNREGCAEGKEVSINDWLEMRKINEDDSKRDLRREEEDEDRETNKEGFVQGKNVNKGDWFKRKENNGDDQSGEAKQSGVKWHEEMNTSEMKHSDSMQALALSDSSTNNIAWMTDVDIVTENDDDEHSESNFVKFVSKLGSEKCNLELENDEEQVMIYIADIDSASDEYFSLSDIESEDSLGDLESDIGAASNSEWVTECDKENYLSFECREENQSVLDTEMNSMGEEISTEISITEMKEPREGSLAEYLEGRQKVLSFLAVPPYPLSPCSLQKLDQTYGVLKSGTGYIMFKRKHITEQELQCLTEADLAEKKLGAVIMKLSCPVLVLGFSVTSIALLVWTDAMPGNWEELIRGSLDLYREDWKVDFMDSCNTGISQNVSEEPAVVLGTKKKHLKPQIPGEESAVVRGTKIKPSKPHVNNMKIIVHIPSIVMAYVCRCVIAEKDFMLLEAKEMTILALKMNFFNDRKKVQPSSSLKNQLENLKGTSISVIPVQISKPLCLLNKEVTHFAMVTFIGKKPAGFDDIVARWKEGRVDKKATVYVEDEGGLQINFSFEVKGQIPSKGEARIQQVKVKAQPSQQCNAKAANSVQSNVEPIQSNVKSVQSNVKPVKSNVKSVQSNVKPVQSNVKPVQSNEKPVQSNVKPIQSNVKPVKSNEKPVQSNVKPIQSNVKPVKSNAKPVQSKVKPVQSNVKSNVKPVKSNAKPVQSNVKPVQSNVKPVQSNVKPVQSNVKPVKSNAKPNGQSTGSVNIPLPVSVTPAHCLDISKSSNGTFLHTNFAKILQLNKNSGLLTVTHQTMGQLNIFFKGEAVFINKEALCITNTVKSLLSPLVNKPFGCLARAVPKKKKVLMCDIRVKFLADVVWYGEKPPRSMIKMAQSKPTGATAAQTKTETKSASLPSLRTSNLTSVSPSEWLSPDLFPLADLSQRKDIVNII